MSHSRQLRRHSGETAIRQLDRRRPRLERNPAHATGCAGDASTRDQQTVSRYLPRAGRPRATHLVDIVFAERDCVAIHRPVLDIGQRLLLSKAAQVGLAAPAFVVACRAADEAPATKPAKTARQIPREPVQRKRELSGRTPESTRKLPGRFHTCRSNPR